ncbi:MAG: hypothetical protein KDI90_10850 [Alphaproteobacteria bacterium]|nr:hypothetical protein [Alphaproteobacteria bacterium]MCB9975629.1 hypothetical protein [Rhodospirillales bacterium]
MLSSFKSLAFACLFLVLSAGSVLAAAVPDTCDEDFWDVLRARAWEEANREITQNQNLIAKPDSVLQYICFDRYMNHLARYAENGGPEDPDNRGNTFTDIPYDLYVLLRQIAGIVDPDLTEGLDMNSVLEILILDSLTDGVSLLSIADPGGAQAAACGRGFYIDENFGHTMLGGRSTISGAFPSNVSDSNYNCNRMRQVWDAAKCYNFQTAANDAFFIFQNYEATEAAGDDYRLLENSPPDNCADLDTNFADLICNFVNHGTPSIPLPPGWPWGGGAPTVWTTAFPAANPLPGAAGGSDSALSFFNLLDPTACGGITPVKTGLIVTRPGVASQYTDAVCPAPGCWYQPGGSIAAAGTCNP